MYVEILIPITLFITIGLVLYKVVEQNNLTKRKMIEAGMNPNEAIEHNKEQKFSVSSYKPAGLFIGVGLGLLLSYFFQVLFNLDDPDALYFGLTALFGGLGLVAGQNLANAQLKKEKS